MGIETPEAAGISFQETERQSMIRQMVRDFGAREILPHMMEWDEHQVFPVELFRKMGDIGLMGILVPEEYGGAGLGYPEYVTALLEISRIDGSVGLSMAAHNSLCTNHILTFGSEAIKQKYLPRRSEERRVGKEGR